VRGRAPGHGRRRQQPQRIGRDHGDEQQEQHAAQAARPVGDEAQPQEAGDDGEAEQAADELRQARARQRPRVRPVRPHQLLARRQGGAGDGEGIGWVAALAPIIGALGGSLLGAKNDKDAAEEAEEAAEKAAKKEAKKNEEFRKQILDVLKTSVAAQNVAKRAAIPGIVPIQQGQGASLPTLPRAAPAATSAIVPAAPAPVTLPSYAPPTSGFTLTLPRNWWMYAAAGVGAILLWRATTR